MTVHTMRGASEAGRAHNPGAAGPTPAPATIDGAGMGIAERRPAPSGVNGVTSSPKAGRSVVLPFDALQLAVATAHALDQRGLRGVGPRFPVGAVSAHWTWLPLTGLVAGWYFETSGELFRRGDWTVLP